MAHTLTHARPVGVIEQAIPMRDQAAWLGAGALLSFLVPFTLTSLVSLHHDL